MNDDRREILRAAVATALVSRGLPSRAQAWPARPIRIVHGYDSGSNPDTISRILAPALGERLGQPVIVEGKPGAAGRIAGRYVATQPGDGYTLLMATAGDAVVAALDPKVPYQLLQDFSFVSGVVEFPFLFCVPANSPFKTLTSLLEDARRRPGQISFGTPGIGTTHSLAGELLQQMAQVELLHIPYKGNSFQDLLGERVSFLIATPSVSLPLIQSGKVRAIAVTSREAYPGMPDASPIDRSVPGYDVRSWLGLLVPKSTPAAITQALASAVQSAIGNDPVRAGLVGTGSGVSTGGSEAFRARVETDVKKWATLSGRVKLTT